MLAAIGQASRSSFSKFDKYMPGQFVIKRLALLFTLAFISGLTQAAGMDTHSQREHSQPTNFSSATAWRGMYFIAVTKKKPGEIDLSQELMSGLLSSINARSAIYTGAAIEPQYLINAKGTTAWIGMWAFITHANPELLKSLGNGPGLAWVTPAWMNKAFGNHINWPEKMLRSHKLELRDYKLVAIPFLLPNNGLALKNMTQSIKAPDGSVEVFGFHEFDETNPEALLVAHERVARFIEKERPDLLKP
ncbi:hypothetical protein [Massilia endophytica]|uniref:hypothetical protein n=1 Tax=Massilia endophytica TaxID=2899220 RepID=UPI001E5151FE|nr:hypothetical protein [Massilia endophytica]UGQ45891.1 hypothetical protein LSQ66_19190 [Massilia endophytica]